MKKSLLLLLLFCLPVTFVMAQEASTSIWDDPMVMFYTVVAFIFVTVLLILAVAMYLLQVLNFLVQQQAKERALKLGIEYVKEPGIWDKLNAWLWDIAPIEKEKDIMMHHEYDGIRELDNHLPPWWRWLLYGTIVFAVVYMVMYHITDSLPMQEEEYATELAVADAEMKKMSTAESGPVLDETTVVELTDVASLDEGKKIFISNCASCHKESGAGDIGPNLTDEYWIHGGSIGDLFKVIKNGVPATNMISWAAMLSPKMMQQVSSYILTLKGTNPPNAKDPQGEKYIPKPKEVAVDTATVSASM